MPSLTIHAVGDVAPKRTNPESIFSGVFDVLGQADALLGQLECTLSRRGFPSPGSRLPMRSDPGVAAILKRAGFSAVSIAGNHALDYGAVALSDTMDCLRQAGLSYCGGGVGLAEARRPAIIDAAGRRVAMLAYSSILPEGYAAQANHPGCAPLRVDTHYSMSEPDQPGCDAITRTYALQEDLDALVEDIRLARDQADVVAVSFHWGIHFRRATIADYQPVVARAAIDAGADMILGHHPHVLKGIEIYRGRPIIYSMGNFAIEQPSAFKENVHLDDSFATISALSNDWKPRSKYMNPDDTRHTLIARIALDDDQISLALRPCRIDDDSVPHLLKPGTGEWTLWLGYMRAISSEAGFTTAYEPEGDWILVS